MRRVMTIVAVVGISVVPCLALAQQGSQQPYQPSQTSQPSQPSQGSRGSQGSQAPQGTQGSQDSQGSQTPPSQTGQPSQGGADQGAPAVTSVQLVSEQATIQKIDKQNRIVTLRGPQKNMLDVKLSPDVNIDKLKTGDKVMATYYEEVAIAIAPSGKGAPKPVAATSTTTERGGVTARQMTVTARVLSVDPQRNTVQIQGPGGARHMLEVKDPDLQAQLRNIKPGDNLDVTYTQAVAVSLQPQATTK